MPRKTIISDTYVFDALVFDKYQSGDTNSAERRRMLKLMYQVMKNELTAKELTCLKEHYLYGKKMKDIAAEWGVHPSNVTRAIKRSRKKLEHIIEYYR